MLEIASEIIICLLLATLIGFALGYLVAKSQSEKTNERSKKKPLEQPKENSYFDKPVFRAKFEDATESISQLFFIKDFVKKVIEDSSNEDDS